ncbi:MAG TPA: hypothetical protein VF462_04090 [Micromonosporaceae bacterium]
MLPVFGFPLFAGRTAGERVPLVAFGERTLVLVSAGRRVIGGRRIGGEARARDAGLLRRQSNRRYGGPADRARWLVPRERLLARPGFGLGSTAVGESISDYV